MRHSQARRYISSRSSIRSIIYNAKEVKVLRLTLEEMGDAQPPTPIRTDNTTASGIANGTIKRQRSRAMDMRFFWIADQADQRNFKVLWAPGQENLGDYSKKNITRRHITEMYARFICIRHRVHDIYSEH